MATRIKTTTGFSEPTRTVEGFLLIDPGDVWSWSRFLTGGGFLLVWCGISFSVFSVFLINFLSGQGGNFNQLLPLLVTGIFALVGMVGLIWGIRLLLVIVRLKPGELVLPQYPLRLGDACRVHYRRQLRSGSTQRKGKITAQLICYEWVQYRQGTDTKTATHTLWEETFPLNEVDRGTRRVEYDAQIHIAPHNPPSFSARSNQIRWEMRVNLDLPGVAKDASHFRLQVVPEVIA